MFVNEANGEGGADSVAFRECRKVWGDQQAGRYYGKIVMRFSEGSEIRRVGNLNAARSNRFSTEIGRGNEVRRIDFG